MFAVANLIHAAAEVIRWVLWAYTWVILAAVILSWVGADPWNPIVQSVRMLADLTLRPVREKLPVTFGAVDLSPMAVLLAIQFLSYFLVPTLHELAQRLRG